MLVCEVLTMPAKCCMLLCGMFATWLFLLFVVKAFEREQLGYTYHDLLEIRASDVMFTTILFLMVGLIGYGFGWLYEKYFAAPPVRVVYIDRETGKAVEARHISVYDP